MPSNTGPVRINQQAGGRNSLSQQTSWQTRQKLGASLQLGLTIGGMDPTHDTQAGVRAKGRSVRIVFWFSLCVPVALVVGLNRQGPMRRRETGKRREHVIEHRGKRTQGRQGLKGRALGHSSSAARKASKDSKDQKSEKGREDRSLDLLNAVALEPSVRTERR